MADSRLSQSYSEASYRLPKKQEWSILYQHKAMELQKAKNLQKLLSKHKKQEFKKQLDEQITSKNSAGQYQKIQDRKYYDYITKNAEQMKMKEERQKVEKHRLRRRIQNDNQRSMELHTDPKIADYGKIYNIEIGFKSQQQRKSREEFLKQKFAKDLNEQIQKKQQQKYMQKIHEQQSNKRNENYQAQYHSNREINNKKFQQNPQVYKYYKDIYNQKIKKQRDLQHKFLDDVLVKKQQEEVERNRRQESLKERRSLEMKDTLSKQVQIHNIKKIEQTRPNPQAASYKFIENVFKDKRPHFDKKQYYKYLEKQAQEQRYNKIQKNYMSNEQYKFNANQLNRAVNGNYNHEKYMDRSLNAIGDKIQVNDLETLHNEDSSLVKNKLDILKSYDQSRNRRASHEDNSFLF